MFNISIVQLAYTCDQMRFTIHSRNQINSNQIKCWFRGEGKTGVPGEKPLRAEKRTNKLSPHMTPSPGIEPGLHLVGGECSTTAPSLLPYPQSWPSPWGFDFFKNCLIHNTPLTGLKQGSLGHGKV